MQTILNSDIIEIDRQRKDYDQKKLSDLATSIQTKGLLHAVVLQDDRKTLVAGGRRRRAIKLLHDLDISFTYNGQTVPQNHVPYVTLQEQSEDNIIEAELEENIVRDDLTWMERTAAIARLHALRTKQNPAQTIRETSKEIAGEEYIRNDTEVREAIILNEHLDDPEVAQAKSRKDAMKIVKRKAEQKMTAQLAKEFDISKTPHLLYHGDFRTYAQTIATGSVDVILTDPPYGIGANEFGDQAGAQHGYEDSREYFEEIITAFVVEATRVAKDKAHLYTFCDPRGYDFIARLLQRHGWDVWRTPLIWSKRNGMLPEPDFGPRRTYEYILFANRNRKKVRAVYSDVIELNGLSNPQFGAEKPAELYLNLLRRSVVPGNTVWDPFIGAGPIFAGANELSVRVIGSELIEEKYNYAKLRLDETAGQTLEALVL